MSPRRIVLSRQHLPYLDGQILAETTCGRPHQPENVRWADAPHYARAAADGKTVLGPRGRQALDQVAEETAPQIAERIRRWLVANI
jgi:hypothetical protein